MYCFHVIIVYEVGKYKWVYRNYEYDTFTYSCEEQSMAPEHKKSIAKTPVAGFDTDLHES